MECEDGTAFLQDFKLHDFIQAVTFPFYSHFHAKIIHHMQIVWL